MVVNLIHEFKELGFSEYEARAYAALLCAESPASAYETAKLSQIPSSKIYEVMGKLEERGMVYPAETGGTKKYIPADPDEFIARHRLKTESALDRFSNSLKSVHHEQKNSLIYNIADYDVLIDKALRMIRSARKEILVSAWNTELETLEPALLKAEQKKLLLSAIHFGKTNTKAGQLFLHPIADTIYSEKGGRGLVIVCDSREALIGTVYPDGSVEGGASENTGFAALAEDYIKHDIYIMKIVNRFDNDLKRRFGENYHLLRDIFSDRELTL